MTAATKTARVLVASPVRQPSTILGHFLKSLTTLDDATLHLDFAFVDDNDDPEASDLLHSFAHEHGATILDAPAHRPDYHRDGDTHRWTEELIQRVASHKDRLLQLALDGSYDAALLVDADLVLHPRTAAVLWDTRVDIVSEVFWTRFREDGDLLPQVWLFDHYTLHAVDRGVALPPDEEARRTRAFIDSLAVPGLHEVGGLGACTLLSRAALTAGVSFAPLPNLSWVGEDRHFCLRAAALGFSLYAETTCPPLHLYRAEDLGRVDTWLAEQGERDRQVDAVQSFAEGLRSWGDKHWLTWSPDQGLEAFEADAEARLREAGLATGEQLRTRSVWTQVELRQARDVHLDSDHLTLSGTARVAGREVGTAVCSSADVAALLRETASGWRIEELSLQPAAAPAPRATFVRRGRANRVTLSMLVRNEADRYLRDVLSHAASWVDEAVVLDDASTDGSADLCEAILRDAGIPHRVVRLETSLFSTEWRLRQLQWQLVACTRPDWILCLDADELFEDSIVEDIGALVDQGRYDAVAFRLFDMWDAEHYRDDALWTAHHRGRPMLQRWNPNQGDEWLQTDQHCGRWPLSTRPPRTLQSPARLKHLGWMKPADRIAKHARYLRLDAGARFGDAEQYRSILDDQPHLSRFD